MDTKQFICECGSLEHQVIFWYDDEPEGFDSLYMEVHLVRWGFWRRVKVAIKYIFGYRSRYGEFDSIIIDPADCDRLTSIIERYKKVHHEKGKNHASVTTN